MMREFITPEDVQRYTCRDCHLLAYAINRQTDWPLCAFVGEDDQPTLHSFVLLPDGRALDIEGAHSLIDLRARWGGAAHREVTIEELVAVAAEFGPLELSSLDRALALAPRLVGMWR